MPAYTVTHHHHYDPLVLHNLDSQLIDLVNYHTHDVNAIDSADDPNYPNNPAVYHITEQHSHDYPRDNPDHRHYALLAICLRDECRFHYNDGHSGALYTRDSDSPDDTDTYDASVHGEHTPS